MSIKAANIDIEFEKCEEEITIPEPENGNLKIFQKIMVEDKNSQFNFKTSPVQQQSNNFVNNDSKFDKFQVDMYWEKNDEKEKESQMENFQESLVCEVEDANDDENDGGR